MNTLVTLRQRVQEAMMACPRCDGTGLVYGMGRAGSILRAARRERGILLKDMAGRLRVSIGYLHDLEFGRRDLSASMAERYIVLLEDRHNGEADGELEAGP